jgi:hypothetical protein
MRMGYKAAVVIAIYFDRPTAENGVDTLYRAGFEPRQISVVLPQDVPSTDVAIDSKASKGIAAGTGLGTLAGGSVGLLAGLGLLMIPGLGPILAAGPIVATLGGMVAGGATGALAGSIVGLGISEKAANRYEACVREGRVLVTVHCESEEDARRAEEILRGTGPEEVTAISAKRRVVRRASGELPACRVIPSRKSG